MAYARIPFFMFDMGNYELIILPNVPLEVKSAKEIKWVPTETPGGSTTPMQFSTFGPQTLSFTIKVIDRNPYAGNLPILKQFEKLRVPTEGLMSLLFDTKSNANPQVLFWYGTGNLLPLVYYVTKCEFNHIMIGKFNFPEATEIDMELKLDESHILYRAERIARMALSIAGMGLAIYRIVQAFMDEKPY